MESSRLSNAATTKQTQARQSSGAGSWRELVEPSRRRGPARQREAVGGAAAVVVVTTAAAPVGV